MVGFSATMNSLDEASNSFPTFTSPVTVKYDNCGGKRKRRRKRRKTQTKKKSMKKRRKSRKRKTKRKTKKRRKSRKRSKRMNQVGCQRGGSKFDMSASYSTTPSSNLEMPWALCPY